MTRKMQAAQVQHLCQPLVQKELDIPTPGVVKFTLLIKEHDAAKLAYLGKKRCPHLKGRHAHHLHDRTT